MFQSYIADALKAIAENTAKMSGEGVGMSRRYADLIQEMDAKSKPQEEEKRTAADIINHMKDKLNNLNGG